MLGSGEVKLADMVNAYEGFANGGVHYDPIMVLKVSDSKGKVLEENKPTSSPKRVLDPQVAYLMNNVLSDNGARSFIFGANNPLTLPGRPVAAKTGTTEHYNDAWTMGYTPSLVTGVWAGNNDNSPMSSEAADIAAPLWHDAMVTMLAGTPVEQFSKPDGIKQVTLDAYTGKTTLPNSTHLRTDIFPSWYKPTDPVNAGSAKIDKVSGLLATDCTPPLAIQNVTISPMHAEIPPTDPAYGRWDPPVQGLAASLGYSGGATLPTSNDKVHSCSDTKPTVNLTTSDNGDGTWHLSVHWTSGTFPVNQLDVKLDDQIISTQALIAQAVVIALISQLMPVIIRSKPLSPILAYTRPKTMRALLVPGAVVAFIPLRRVIMPTVILANPFILPGPLTPEAVAII